MKSQTFTINCPPPPGWWRHVAGPSRGQQMGHGCRLPSLLGRSLGPGSTPRPRSLGVATHQPQVVRFPPSREQDYTFKNWYKQKHSYVQHEHRSDKRWGILGLSIFSLFESICICVPISISLSLQHQASLNLDYITFDQITLHQNQSIMRAHLIAVAASWTRS